MSNLYTTIFPYALTTTLILGGYLTWRHWPTVLRIVKATLFISAILTIGYFATKEPTVVEVSKIIEVQKPEESIEELLEEIPESYGVSRIAVEEIIKKESNGNHAALRFEPHHMERAAKFSKNVDEQRMYSSSHGLMQVMAWHLPPMGLSWVDLYNKRTNIEVGTKILKDCLNRQKGSKWEKYYGAMVCYNGSTKYADDMMVRIGKRLAEAAL